jgi:hypothetical protein
VVAVGTIINETWEVKESRSDYVALENISGKTLTDIFLEDGGDHDGYKVHASWPSSPGLRFGVHPASSKSYSGNRVVTPGQFTLTWKERGKGVQKAVITF